MCMSCGLFPLFEDGAEIGGQVEVDARGRVARLMGGGVDADHSDFGVMSIRVRLGMLIHLSQSVGGDQVPPTRITANP